MYRSILSVLLMGMLPMSGIAPMGKSSVPDIAVAPPSALVRAGSGALAFARLPATLSASGMIIMDLKSGQTLLARSARVRRPMASLTKLMTALIITEHHALDEEVTIPADLADIEGNVVPLPPGEHFTVGDLLSALLIGSANDAAYALALFHSGSVSSFVEEMNGRARELGLLDTSFRNPAGFDEESHWSTPQDLAWLSLFVWRQPDIRHRMGTRGVRIRSREGNMFYITHTHALLHAETPVIAGKTGTTDGAAQCLLSIVEEEGKLFVVILLKSRERYEDLQRVLTALKQILAYAT